MNLVKSFEILKDQINNIEKINAVEKKQDIKELLSKKYKKNTEFLFLSILGNV